MLLTICYDESVVSDYYNNTNFRTLKKNKSNKGINLGLKTRTGPFSYNHVKGDIIGADVQWPGFS